METPVFAREYGHMTQVFSYSGKQRAVKRNENEIAPRREAWHRPSLRLQAHLLLGGGEGRGAGRREGDRSIFFFELHVEKRGGRHRLLLDFWDLRILRVHICQLSSSKVEKEEELEVFEPSEVKHSERLRPNRLLKIRRRTTEKKSKPAPNFSLHSHLMPTSL